MTTYTRPGVYVEELPGPQLITQVSTSNTAFVGSTALGAPAAGDAPEAQLITSWNAFTAQFGGFAWGTQLPLAVYAFYAQGGQVCYVVSQAAAGEATALVDLTPLKVSAASPGVWGNLLSLQITNAPAGNPGDPPKPIFAINVLYKLPEPGTTLSLQQQLIARYASGNNLAPVIINGAQYYLLESFSGLSANDVVKATATATAPIETRINPASLFIRVEVAAGTTDPTRPDNLTDPEAFAGGADPTAPPDMETGLGALDTLDDISLLVTPEVAMIESYETQRSTAELVLSYCENRPHRDLFAILDLPYDIAVQDAETYKTGGAVGDAEVGTALHSSYGAVYYPWIEILNPASSRNVPVPPSGTMAGTYAAADLAVGPWQSPAGITFGALNVATGVQRVMTPGDQSILNPNGINAILPMTGYGILAYGARTLTTDPSTLYIAVRRTLMDIEVSLYRGLQWVVFEPNTPRLWGSVTRDVTEFLTSMWHQGALVGQKASEAFWVQCDASNNPPDLQRKGQLVVDIGVAPSYPAEFVIVRIQQTTVGAS